MCVFLSLAKSGTKDLVVRVNFLPRRLGAISCCRSPRRSASPFQGGNSEALFEVGGTGKIGQKSVRGLRCRTICICFALTFPCMLLYSGVGRLLDLEEN